MCVVDPRHTECSNLTEARCKCMSCHKAMVVITERAHCFYDCIYIYIYIYIYTHTRVQHITWKHYCENLSFCILMLSE